VIASAAVILLFSMTADSSTVAATSRAPIGARPGLRQVLRRE
jgi:hypothetical protein